MFAIFYSKTLNFSSVFNRILSTFPLSIYVKQIFIEMTAIAE